MRDQDVGCLPVLERERLIGMITDRDIVVRGVAEGLDPHRAIVREAMSANAIACSVEHTVDQARALMAANLIKHLPVLDRGRARRGARIAAGHHRAVREVQAPRGDFL